MKFLLALIVAVSATFPAFAQTRGWYTGFDVGASWMPSQGITFSELGLESNVNATYDFGVIGLWQFGYAYKNNFRIEGEFGGRYNGLSGIAGSVAGQNVSKKVVSWTDLYSLAVNGIYDFRLQDGVRPFMGAGVGVARDATMVQGFAGISYKLSELLDVKAQYRYMLALGAAGAPVVVNGHPGTIDYSNHGVLIGVTYWLKP